MKIKTLTKFKGEKDKATKFICVVELYLHINKHIYNTNEKKIVFTLSFMTDGATAAWKEAYLRVEGQHFVWQYSSFFITVMKNFITKKVTDFIKKIF